MIEAPPSDSYMVEGDRARKIIISSSTKFRTILVISFTDARTTDQSDSVLKVRQLTVHFWLRATSMSPECLSLAKY